MIIPERLYRPTDKEAVSGLRPQFETAYTETSNTIAAITHSYGPVKQDELWIFNSLYTEAQAGTGLNIVSQFFGLLGPNLGKVIPWYGNRSSYANPAWFTSYMAQHIHGMIIPPGWSLQLYVTYSAATQNNILNSYLTYFRVPRGNFAP